MNKWNFSDASTPHRVEFSVWYILHPWSLTWNLKVMVWNFPFFLSKLLLDDFLDFSSHSLIIISNSLNPVEPSNRFGCIKHVPKVLVRFTKWPSSSKLPQGEYFWDAETCFGRKRHQFKICHQNQKIWVVGFQRLRLVLYCEVGKNMFLYAWFAMTPKTNKEKSLPHNIFGGSQMWNICNLYRHTLSPVSILHSGCILLRH